MVLKQREGGARKDLVRQEVLQCLCCVRDEMVRELQGLWFGR